MKKYLTVFVVVICTNSLASIQEQLTYEEAQDLSAKQWKEYKDSNLYRDYFSIWTNFNNQNRIDERGGCYKFGQETVDLVSIQGSDGIIREVITKKDDEKSACFVKAYKGVKFPKPPISPFYHRMQMK
ncbi:hypothetical protein [Microbulbifer sp. PAAF003]